MANFNSENYKKKLTVTNQVFKRCIIGMRCPTSIWPSDVKEKIIQWIGKLEKMDIISVMLPGILTIDSLYLTFVFNRESQTVFVTCLHQTSI